jgi:hypothetical protein
MRTRSKSKSWSTFFGACSGIRYGVRAPVASLDPQPEIRLRQALIRRLRVLVPAIFGLAFFSGFAVTLLEGFGPGFGLRCAGLLALWRSSRLR